MMSRAMLPCFPMGFGWHVRNLRTSNVRPPGASLLPVAERFSFFTVSPPGQGLYPAAALPMKKGSRFRMTPEFSGRDGAI